MNQQPTKNSFTTASTITLEDVKTSIMTSDTIMPAKKSELLSAVSCFAVWIHRTPSEIPADYIYVDRAFERLNFGTLGVRRARFRNVRALVRQALRAIGVHASTRTKAAAFTPEWAALRDRIEDPYAKDCVGRFFRFCSAHGIAPEQVDDSVVGRFLQALTDHNVTPKPEVSVQSAVRLWNRMVEQVPGWPQVRLTPLRRREFYSLSPSQLHPDLVADIDRYASVVSGSDPTDPLTPHRALRPRSVAKRKYEIFQLLAGMRHAGVNVGEMRRLADLCVVELVRKGLTFHIERHRRRCGKDADPRSSSMLGGIVGAIRIVAKYYVQAPEPVVRELTAIASRFSRRSNGMTEKNSARLAQLESPHIQRKFLSHGLIEMGKLARKAYPTRRDAVRYGTLLAIEILIVAPMRIENVAELDLDAHFVWPPNKKDEVIIVVPRRSVKNSVPLEYKIPRGSMPAFNTYLKRFRPKLVKGPSTAFFPGRNGRTKRSDTLSHQIKSLVRKELGLSWTAHLYRHHAARVLLRADPGNYEAARRLLGHLSAETTYKFYEGEEMRPAVERFDALIESIRDQHALNAAFRNRYCDAKKKRD